MKNYFVRSLISIFVVMVLLPVLILFTPADTGMMLCMILFLCVNPIFFLGLGVYAGEQVQELWYMPLVAAGLYLIVAWCMFGFVTAFLLYAAFYLVVAYAAVGIRWLMVRKKKD